MYKLEKIGDVYNVVSRTGIATRSIVAVPEESLAEAYASYLNKCLTLKHGESVEVANPTETDAISVMRYNDHYEVCLESKGGSVALAPNAFCAWHEALTYDVGLAARWAKVKFDSPNAACWFDRVTELAKSAMAKSGKERSDQLFTEIGRIIGAI